MTDSTLSYEMILSSNDASMMAATTKIPPSMERLKQIDKLIFNSIFNQIVLVF